MARKPKDEDDQPKTVVDMKRGKAVDDFKVPVDGTGEDKNTGHNSFEPSGETLDELFAVADEVEDKVAELKEKMRLKTQPEREKIKELNKRTKAARDKLVDDGYGTMELNATLRRRSLQRQAEKVVEQLDPAMKKRFDQMQQAWKDFRSTPLGAAADAGAVH